MNGVVNVLKPPAMSSGDIVGAIRRIYGEKRVGHTGTLDPGASGVLPVCIGRATKLADYIMRGEKEYIAEAVFGVETDTLDSYGNVVGRKPCDVESGAIESMLPKFTGELLQHPPAYSAVKHKGQPLYKLARKGIAVEKPPRSICIHSIGLLGGDNNRFLFQIRCSKGTYIRMLLADIARELGTCAYTSFLLRTETCSYRIENALTLEEIAADTEKAVIPMEDAVGFLPTINLMDHLCEIVLSGTPVYLKKTNLRMEENKEYAVFCKGELIGIGMCREDILKIISMIKIK